MTLLKGLCVYEKKNWTSFLPRRARKSPYGREEAHVYIKILYVSSRGGVCVEKITSARIFFLFSYPIVDISTVIIIIIIYLHVESVVQRTETCTTRCTTYERRISSI